MVRKGIKNGLRSEIDAGVDRFFALYADNVHRHGTPALPKRYFEALQREFGADCDVLIVTIADGRPLSGVLSFYFRDEVLPYYAGDDRGGARAGRQRLQVLGADAPRLRSAASRCSTTAAASGAPGSYAFKKNWGFEPAPLAYEYRLYRGDGIPQNNPINPKYRR